MKPLPRTIAGAMIVVAIVALNFAVARAVYRVDEEIVIGAAVPCVLLQLAVFEILRRCGRARAFWLGFLVLGGLCTASFVWAMLFPEVLGIDHAGKLHRQPGSPLYDGWRGYMDLTSKPLVPYFFDLAHDHEPEMVKAAVFRGVLWSGPQVLFAFVGGAIGLAAFGWARRQRTAEGEVVSQKTSHLGTSESSP